MSPSISDFFSRKKKRIEVFKVEYYSDFPVFLWPKENVIDVFIISSCTNVFDDFTL